MAQQLKIDIVARDKSKQAMGRLQSSLSKVKASVFNLKNAFIGLGAGLVIKSIIKTGIQIENLGVQLKALFGSAKAGKKALDQVKKFAETTPFELSNIQQGVTALATVAEKAESLGITFDELLKITGNTAVQLGGDFAIASQQIQRSFSAGIGSADLFRDKAVTAMAGFSAGVKTNVDDSIKGLAKAFGTGGKFGNLTDELAKTLSGTISNLQDTLFKFQESIASGFFFELKNQLGDLKKFTEDNDEAIRQLGISMGENLATAIVKTSDAVKFLVKNFRDLQATLGVLLIAIGGFLKIIVGVGLIIDDMNRRIKKLTGETGDEIKKVKNFMHELSIPVEQLNEELEYTAQIIRDFESELSIRIPSATEKAMEKFKELNDGVLTGIKEKAENIHMIIAESINSGITKMSEGLARSLVFGEKLTDTLRKMAQNVLAKILATLIEQVARQAVSLFLENTKLGTMISQTGELRSQTKELEKQKKIKGTMMLMSGNPAGFLGFMASGGAVAKGQPTVVGENGAELFIPNQTGQITQSSRGTGGGSGGGSSTVNFNITTLDASGFDDLLVRNRGTITQIINSAVNERGSNNLI
tara:strand:+ start:5115 stop:6875 length:1761 start_codon:yes stop_codon:yes gene_type:complete